jgi:hypothetical protein
MGPHLIGRRLHRPTHHADHAVNNGDRTVGYKLGNIATVMQNAFGRSFPAAACKQFR